LIASLNESSELEPLESAHEPGLPGLLFTSADSQELHAELAARKNLSGPILVIAQRRTDLGVDHPWQLLQAGASDLLILEECREPVGAIAARLKRIAEIEEIATAPLVRQNLVGESACWRQVVRQVVEVSRFSAASLLITGESGTGKELVARLVHTLDPRAEKGELVILDCTTVSPELAGSEFFGHERGAFTSAVAARDGVFALAHGGSLFLDEVGELPLGLQAELLRAVQERTYKRVGSNKWERTDFRLVCATNRDLKTEETRGNFRLDFYHRIACSRCHLPPLRERREDILPLARHFLGQTLKESGELDFDPAVQDFLNTRDYPGNVRELGQLVRLIAQRHVGPGPITIGAVPPEERAPAAESLAHDWRNADFQNALRRALACGAGLQTIREQTAEAVIEIALRDADGNLRRAALKLGVTDRALQMRRAARLDNTKGNGHAELRSPGSPAPPTDRETGPAPMSDSRAPRAPHRKATGGQPTARTRENPVRQPLRPD
jgi:transcriptional regulator with GAF, ATPase, and Fis domain